MAVMLSTSLGDLVIDLHTDLCPLTCKNFLKLCKIKYYNNCLFHLVEKDFIMQTGDPTGTGSGGDSLYKLLYGDQARFFQDEIHPKLKHDKMGTVAMASAGEHLNASQFYITARPDIDYLDGKHTIFGEVAEGFETLTRINDAYVDEKGRPFKNIRVKHTYILDDPFEDPPQLVELIPERSPELKPSEQGEDVRLEDDWVPMDEKQDPEELEKSLRAKEAHSRSVVLEMIGDIPDAEMKPPENVLFICKLNPVTQEEDLEIIFSRFGKVISADIIRDYKTGDSLCYGFIEFETNEACEAAYFKMDNVLIDDRRIHVDFSQSVAKLWTRFRRFGTKAGGEDKVEDEGVKCKDLPRPAYQLKDSVRQHGGSGERYELLFDDGEVTDPSIVKASNSASQHTIHTSTSTKRKSHQDAYSIYDRQESSDMYHAHLGSRYQRTRLDMSNHQQQKTSENRVDLKEEVKSQSHSRHEHYRSHDKVSGGERHGRYKHDERKRSGDLEIRSRGDQLDEYKSAREKKHSHNKISERERRERYNYDEGKRSRDLEMHVKAGQQDEFKSAREKEQYRDKVSEGEEHERYKHDERKKNRDIASRAKADQLDEYKSEREHIGSKNLSNRDKHRSHDSLPDGRRKHSSSHNYAKR